MNRIEFMRELEYLLLDIAEAEKTDALNYYRDYLEEAGDENEQKVLTEFGSPERIAAMIRSDLKGGMESGGEFTENGILDSRFEDPRYRLAKRHEVPMETEPPVEEQSKFQKSRGNHSDASRPLRTVLIIILIFVAFPFVFGIGGTMFGVFTAIAAVLFGIGVSVAAVTAALFAAAIACLGAGVYSLFYNPLQAMLLAGGGVILLGMAMLSLILAILFYGKLMPLLIRSCVNLFHRLFYRQGRVKA